MPKWIPALLLLAFTASPGRAVPPNPRRDTPPPSLRALAEGKPAPGVDAASSLGGGWSLARARRSGPVVLVFYRGDW
jgi:hypothetical protein